MIILGMYARWIPCEKHTRKSKKTRLVIESDPNGMGCRVQIPRGRCTRMNWKRIDIKLGATNIMLFLIVLLPVGFVIDRVFSGFYYNEVRKKSINCLLIMQKQLHGPTIQITNPKFVRVIRF